VARNETGGAVISIMPDVRIDGDTRDRIMARSGALLGVSPARALWRFGFKPSTPLAVAFGVYSLGPLYVLATHQGRPLETMLLQWEAPAMPNRFVHVLEAQL